MLFESILIRIIFVNFAWNYKLEIQTLRVYQKRIEIFRFLCSRTRALHRSSRRRASREKEQVQIFVRRNRLFFVYPLGEKGTPRGLSSPVVRNERTDEVSINSGCVTEIRETNIHICIRMHSQKKKINVATLIYQWSKIKALFFSTLFHRNK